MIKRPQRGHRQSIKLSSSFGLLVLATVAAIALLFSSHRAAGPFENNPLAGTIWTSEFEEITLAQLEAALANARFVLLGEVHNNPDHHRLQAQLIDGLVKK